VEGENMMFSAKIMVLFIFLLGGTSLFAQSPDMQVISLEFKKMDINQDSFVTPDEMRFYQAQIFKKLDKDKSKDIDTEELKADSTDMYKLADKNQDGKITQDESISQFNEYFKQMDKNQDGKVSEAEYTDYWKLIYKF
jgi:Ca2+-binding EF-hand superfamily protein